MAYSKRFATLITTLLLLSACLSACVVNPVTGKKQFSLISAEKEVAIGQQQYQPARQAQGGAYYLDPAIQAYVAGIGHKLAAVSDRPDLPYEFVVLNNPVPNAWALPGGKIAINRGLLTQLQDESELAAVLAHEIVHAAARHGAAQMTRSTFIGIGAQALGAIAQSQGYGGVGGMAAQYGSAAWIARYGRGAELESDAYGMEYMVRAGYDPQGAVKLQETFVQLSKGRQASFLSNLFASHPPSQARVNANRIKAKTYPPGGIVNRAVYQKKLARIHKDQAAYQAQEKAMAALKNKAPEKALSYLNTAVKLQPREGQFWELRGHAWLMLNKAANADKAFSTAISKNPRYFSHHLARGVLRFKQGKKTVANKDLINSHQLLPTPTASLYLGEIASAQGDQKTAIRHYQTAAQAKNIIGQQARDKIAVIEIKQHPSKYILTQLALDADGYVKVALYNQSNIPVKNVIVQISTSTAHVLKLGISSLKAKEKTARRTKIGPFNSPAAINNYQATVVQAVIQE